MQRRNNRSNMAGAIVLGRPKDSLLLTIVSILVERLSYFSLFLSRDDSRLPQSQLNTNHQLFTSIESVHQVLKITETSKVSLHRMSFIELH